MVDENHPLIGKYVIEATLEKGFEDALRICKRMNYMVFEREGVADRFIVKMIDVIEDTAMVLRKLVVGDSESFISNNPEITGERKC